MSDLMNAFSSFSAHKRKRSTQNGNSDLSEPDWKRRTVSLPLRSPAKPRPVTIATSNPTFNIFSGNITPVDTSEDESLNEGFDSRLPSLTESQTSDGSTGTTSSVKVQVSDSDQDMEMTNPTSPTRSRPPIGRSRSNDILSSPRRRPFFLTPEPPPTAVRDRIPTPISSHFDHQEFPSAVAPRHSFPPLHTNLSPMVEQETWSSIGPDGLPSPSTDEYTPQIHDPDAMMLYDQTSDGMSGLRVDDVMDDAGEGYGMGMDGQGDHQQTSRGPRHTRQTSSLGGGGGGQGRTARLHMGFLAGCEKCVLKVPGHYSHILWS